ncbi:MAG: hypothetical protein QW587_07840 [Candidatus Bathyarchaeia archaeon]
MKLRLVHAVASGVVLALAFGFLLIPSLVLVASTSLSQSPTWCPAAVDNRTAETTSAGNKAATGFGETLATGTVLGLSPTTALALALLAAVSVILSFLLVNRFAEVPKTG